MQKKNTADLVKMENNDCPKRYGLNCSCGKGKMLK